jgi:hypothetical protein
LRLPFSIAYHERFITPPTPTRVSAGLVEDDLQPLGKIVPAYSVRLARHDAMIGQHEDAVIG